MKEELKAKTQGGGMPYSFLVKNMNSNLRFHMEAPKLPVLLPSHKQSDLHRTLGMGIAQ